MPWWAGYGDTGNDLICIEGDAERAVGVERRRRSERWREEDMEDMGWRVGLSGGPDTMKDPDAWSKSTFDEGAQERISPARRELRICMRRMKVQ